MNTVDERRVRVRNDRPVKDGPVMYWMQRDQRVKDNWALQYAAECARKAEVSLFVIFNFVPRFGKATLRQYDVMCKGLAEVESSLVNLKIPFILLEGEPSETIPHFVEQCGIGHVVTDFNPLRFTDAWRASVGKKLSVKLSEVDAHNIVPAWLASPKQEFAAYTFRPKITKLLHEFSGSIPAPKPHPYSSPHAVNPIDWGAVLRRQKLDDSVLPVAGFSSGTKAGMNQLKKFIHEGQGYSDKRNDPNLAASSNLSPYLHFGQISAQRVAYEVAKSVLAKGDRDAYLEELIVRRELSDNFCLYNPRYDKVEGAHAWAQQSIAEHARDAREYMYTLEQFERAETHDELWNAAQIEMVTTGKMHGFMRMYWAKKILEWTPDVQTSINTALYLNDRYELDGNDPNGVVGVMWSVCGIHDRAWNERPVFGKVRYMNYNGCKRKFDVKRYIAKYSQTPKLFS